MAYLYRPDGFNVTSTANRLYDINGTPYDHPEAGQMLIDEYILPSLELQSRGSITDMVLNTSEEAKNITVRRQEAFYFGGFTTAADAEIPRTRSTLLEGTIKPPRNSFKAWQRSKDNGDIVFKSYEKYNNSLRESPGLRSQDVTGEFLTSYESFVVIPVTPIRSLGSLNRWLVPSSIEGRYFNISWDPKRSVWRHLFGRRYRRYTIPNSPVWIYPSDVSPLVSDFTAMSDGIRSIKPATAIVTEALCEAQGIVWDLSTEIAELVRETAPMIIDAALAILTKYREVRGSIKKLRKNSLSSGSLKADIAKLWLQYRYAIQPLAYSIDDMLAYLDLEVKQYTSTRKGAWREFTLPDSAIPVSIPIQERVLVRDLFEIEDLGRFHGLGLDGIKTAWELLPLSFVVDWVLNVGDVITASSAWPPGLKSRKIMQSNRSRHTVEYTPGNLPGSLVQLSFDSYSRSRISGIPGLAFQPNLTPKRLLDSLAIYWGSKSGPVRRTIRRF